MKPVNGWDHKAILAQGGGVFQSLLNGVAYVNIVGAANEEFIKDQGSIDNIDQRIFNAIQSMGVHTMHITIRIAPIEIFEYRNTSSSYSSQS
ncbi:hypothetical protein FQK07_10280 [Synechococcus sp. BSF8S]|uniref:hypothetical protein n=1 Tax=Synechococcales TaxID=1890424 RepID=UPI0016252916|nr:MULTISPECIES: hypothetical protein [unclassified Synechococcus]MBC1261641.1 hypothetical protein [Synechococcus sp. BSF8S]MBC1264570.1 hypothetical protein [Synechococcus sp. BSA11S]